MPTTLEIDVYSRWDAVELLGRLSCYHSHLVQLDLPGGRWLVRARTPGEHGEGIVSALAVVDAWQQEHHLDSVGVCINGGPPLAGADVAGLSFEGDLRPRVVLQTGMSL
jgi:hypothetical protein